MAQDIQYRPDRVDEQVQKERISRAGDFAEAEFCRLTGAVPIPERSIGDARLGRCTVEVKATSMPARNLNQIRPYKYLPLVVYLKDASPPFATWYVVPAHQLVLLAATHNPQHALSSFECLKLVISKKGFSSFRVDDHRRLGERVLEADAGSKALTDLHNTMTNFGVAAEHRARESQRSVSHLLKAAGLLA